MLDAVQKSLLLGQTYEMLGNIDGAKRSFAQVASQANRDVTAKIRAAQFYMQSDPAQAKTQLEAVLRIDPKSVMAKRLLAIVDASLGDFSQAESLLSETGSDKTVATEDLRLHAVLLLQQGGTANLQRAVDLLEDIISPSSANAPVQPVDNLLLAHLYEQQAQVDDDPLASEARLVLAQRQFVLLAERSTPPPAHLAALVKFLIRHGKSADAVPWLTKLEDRVDALGSVDPDAIALVIEVQIVHGSAERSEKWIQKLEKIDLQPLRPLALKAKAAISRDAHVDVEALIEPKAASLLANAKTSEEKQQLYGGVGDLYVTVKNDAAAERWYRLLMAVDASKFPVVVGALTRQGRLKEAIDVCEQMAQTDATVQPALTLATALVGASPTELDFRRAEPILAAALKKFDTDLRLLYAVSLVRVIQGKEADAVALFRNVVKVNPRFVPALNNLAMMLAERPADRAEALQLIDRAIEIAGKDPGLLDTKGTILVYSGRTREAMPVLELATRGSKVDPRHNFHLALAYRDQGKTEEAKAQLKTALNGNLGSLILTPTDRKLLSDLRAAFQL
jgi:tetratricopeptide (TPR) repeat protein